MDKRPDFGRDLEVLDENVTAEVGNVLKALREGKAIKKRINAFEDDSKDSQGHTTAPIREQEEPSSVGVRRRQRSANRSRLKPIVERDEAQENVTTRLYVKTNELLTEAALRQRLKGVLPATRQGIVEAALGDWFRKYGYVPSRDIESSD